MEPFQPIKIDENTDGIQLRGDDYFGIQYVDTFHRAKTLTDNHPVIWKISFTYDSERYRLIRQQDNTWRHMKIILTDRGANEVEAMLPQEIIDTLLSVGIEL